jgi:hypothetical protein
VRAGLQGSVEQSQAFLHAGQTVAAVDGARARRAGGAARDQLVDDGEPNLVLGVVEAGCDRLALRVFGGVDQCFLSGTQQGDGGVGRQRPRQATGLEGDGDAVALGVAFDRPGEFLVERQRVDPQSVHRAPGLD